MADQSNPLLDFLGGLSQGIQEVAAFRQAALGNPQAVQMLQEQRRQQNLLNQLQTMSQQEMAGPFGETLKRQLQFGDVAGAQKTLINLPRYKEIQTTLENPQLGLAPETRSAIASLSALDPELGAKALQQNLYQTEVGKRREREIEKTFQQRTALEEKKTARREASLPGSIVATAIENKEVDPTDVPSIVGLLQAANVPNFPTNENEARIYVSRILNSPRIKKLIPKKEEASFKDSFLNFFRSKQQAAPAQEQAMPTATPAVPVQQQQTLEQKMLRMQELLNKQGK